MPVSTLGNLGVSEFVDLEVNATVETLVAVADEYVYGVEVDNTQNTEDSFFKMWDLASVNLGTDLPDWVFRVDGGKRMFFPMTGGDEDTDSTSAGVKFDTASTGGVSIACVTTGGTGGTTAPANKVTATVITS